MSESSTTSFFSGDPFERLVIAFITSVAVLAAVVALLHTNASALADEANRDAQQYTVQAMGRNISGAAQVDYGWYAYQMWDELDSQARSAEGAGDETAGRRYRTVRDRIAELSPMLAPPYFDLAGEAFPRVTAYEADVFLVESTALAEHYAASAALDNAWGNKANAYVTHLTMLAVTLFLYGLAMTVWGWTRWLFVGAGSAIVSVVLIWAGVVTFSGVPSLPDEAIDAYARGVGYAHQWESEEALAAFDQALEESPGYANAFFERGIVHHDLGDYEAAAADYEAARAVGRDDINVVGNLGWTYYLLGRFDDAIRMDRHALELDSRRIGVRFNLGLALLAAGQVEAAQHVYREAMEVASRSVVEARAAGQEPPSSLWVFLDAGGRDLDSLVDRINARPHDWTEAPPGDTIADPDAVVPVAESLLSRLKSLTAALESTGQPPGVQVTAYVSAIEFALPRYDDEGNLLGHTVTSGFPYGTDRVLALYDYQGMQDGQDVLWKLYRNGWEDPSWRLLEDWSLGEMGSAQKPFSLAYSNLYFFSTGEYAIEMYVDSQLMQRGSFTIESPED